MENGINLVKIEISQEWKQSSWKWKRVFTWKMVIVEIFQEVEKVIYLLTDNN